MSFLTKRSLNGLGTAGKTNPFAAIEDRRIAYAGRSRSQTAGGEYRSPSLSALGQLPAFQIPGLRITPEGRFEFDTAFPSTQEPTPTPTIPAEAFPEEITTDVQVPGVEEAARLPVDVKAKAEEFGRRIIETIRTHPKEALAIAGFGILMWNVLRAILRKK